MESRFPFSLQLITVAVLAFGAMWFSALHPRGYYNYTQVIAGCLLEGSVGTTEQPPRWLNEMVPHEGRYYSVFPLGAVLSVLPFEWLRARQFVSEFPLRFLISAIASGITVFGFALAVRYSLPVWKQCFLAAAPLFGTCLWPNLAFGGAWQVALGFAVLGTMGAICFATGTPRPFLAGAFFALGFGNRTEVLLTAPVFYFLLWRSRPKSLVAAFVTFSIAPTILGISTLAYNAARFGSPFDFGYARIPGVLDEPWYKDGIFALSAIPRNAYAMLIEPWKRLPGFPWLVPDGWGGSLFLFSPFLFLLARFGRGDLAVRLAGWAAISVLTFLLWIHGNPGGWQVSYRYASVLFPWALLILLETEPRQKIGWFPALAALSIAINAYATWIFCETKYMVP